jgi:hypothetical protein
MHFCIGSAQSFSSSRQSPPGPGGEPVVESTDGPVGFVVEGSTSVVPPPEEASVVVGAEPDSPLPSLPPLSPQPAHGTSTHERKTKRRMWAEA